MDQLSASNKTGLESVSSRAVRADTAPATAVARTTTTAPTTAIAGSTALAFALALTVTGAAVRLPAFFLTGCAFLLGFRWSAVSCTAAVFVALGRCGASTQQGDGDPCGDLHRFHDFLICSVWLDGLRSGALRVSELSPYEPALWIWITVL